MKHFTQTLLISSLLMANVINSQAQTDTICAGAPGVNYSVTNNAGSLYAWVVVGGTITAGIGTNEVTVNWGAVPGLYSISVVETSSFGCVGDPVSLPVRVLSLPTAIISGTNMLCQGSSSSLAVALTGLGPWNLTYSDGTTSTTVNGISTNPYVFNTPSLSANKTYTVTAVSDGYCAGTTAGSAILTVNPKPITSAITRH